MFLEIINKIVVFFNDLFEVEDLNGDEYPRDYIIIENKKGKEELIYYE